jgi:hypothetical protein
MRADFLSVGSKFGKTEFRNELHDIKQEISKFVIE